MLYYRLHLNIVSQVVWFFFSLSYGVEGGISRDWLKKKKKKNSEVERARERQGQTNTEKNNLHKNFTFTLFYFS